MKQRLKLFIPLAFFIILLPFFLKGLWMDPNEMPSALIDDGFPEFNLPKLTTPDQNIIVTKADMKGQPALVNIWATWCTACKIEHPVLNRLADEGIPIIGINYKDNSAAALKWLDELGNPYQFNIVDQRGTLGIDLGVFGAPETYFVDAKGVIRYKHVGIVDMNVWDTHLKPLFDQYNN